MGIVLTVGNTGGPGGGKSSSLSVYQEYLIKAGYIPIFLQETATRLILSGIKLGGILGSDFKFQEMLFQLQKKEEDIYFQYLNSCKENIILIYDRTLLDGRAYESEKNWNLIIKKLGMTKGSLLSRYDIIIHLVSAADGAEEFYTCENNKARTETVEEARAKDLLTKEAYYGHRNVHYITNECDFEQKLIRAAGVILSALGKAVPLGVQKKFLVNKVSHDTLTEKMNAQVVQITQHYLTSIEADTERRIRKVVYQDGNSYYYTEKKYSKQGNKNLIPLKDYPISYQQYVSYQQEVISKEQFVKKDRWYFSWENQYMNYDEFADHIAILEVQVTDRQQEVKIPGCFEVIREVTDESLFDNRNLAHL